MPATGRAKNSAKSAAVEIAVDGLEGPRTVRLSSADRLLWPEAGITKLDLANYVVAVGPALLRAFGDRPVTLERYPEGVGGEVFYAKNPPRGMPPYARAVPVVYPSGRSHPQLVIDEVATAVWAVQMNTITFHPWPVHTANTDNPDELRIDLDPQPGRGFKDAVTAAHQLRALMAELGLTGRVKTSGNRGLHVFASITPEHEFLDVRHAVIGIGRELERRTVRVCEELLYSAHRRDQRFRRADPTRLPTRHRERLARRRDPQRAVARNGGEPRGAAWREAED